MKKFIVIFTSILTSAAFAQNKTGKSNEIKSESSQVISEQDTIIKVVNGIKYKGGKNPAYFINGELVDQSAVKFLDPNKIDNVKVEKENTKIDNINYSGKILIETKKGYKPKLISLDELRKQYTTLEEDSVIFQIDNEIVDGDCKKYVVDKNYILKITINKLEKPNLSVIKVINKSEENIKKSNEILIRGDTIH